MNFLWKCYRTLAFMLLQKRSSAIQYCMERWGNWSWVFQECSNCALPSVHMKLYKLVKLFKGMSLFGLSYFIQIFCLYFTFAQLCHLILHFLQNVLLSFLCSEKVRCPNCQNAVVIIQLLHNLSKRTLYQLCLPFSCMHISFSTVNWWDCFPLTLKARCAHVKMICINNINLYQTAVRLLTADKIRLFQGKNAGRIAKMWPKSFNGSSTAVSSNNLV